MMHTINKKPHSVRASETKAIGAIRTIANYMWESVFRVLHAI